MRRNLLYVAAAILSMTLVTTAQAGPRGGGAGGRGSGGSGPGRHNPTIPGPHYPRGWTGPAPRVPTPNPGWRTINGKGGHRWGKKVFDKGRGCRIYLDGGTWYYWCPPDNCYYSIDYCPYGTYAWEDQGDDGD